MAEILRPALRDAIIFRADLPIDEPRRVSDAQIDTLINRSLSRLQGILATFHSEDYFFETLPFSVAASTISVGNFASKIIHVLWRAEPFDSNTRPRNVRLDRMKEEDWVERGQGLPESKWSKTNLPKWWVGATTGVDHGELHFEPSPTDLESVLIIYRAELKFADDVSPVFLAFAWEEWIVLDCLLAIRQRDKQDSSDIAAERERTEQRIREQAPERFLDDRNTVRDLDPGVGFGTRRVT